MFISQAVEYWTGLDVYSKCGRAYVNMMTSRDDSERWAGLWSSAYVWHIETFYFKKEQGKKNPVFYDMTLLEWTLDSHYWLHTCVAFNKMSLLAEIFMYLFFLILFHSHNHLCRCVPSQKPTPRNSTVASVTRCSMQG